MLLFETRDHGVYLDAGVSMTAHVTETVLACFVVLQWIRSVRHAITHKIHQSMHPWSPSCEALLSLIQVISKLDFPAVQGIIWRLLDMIALTVSA